MELSWKLSVRKIRIFPPWMPPKKSPIVAITLTGWGEHPRKYPKTHFSKQNHQYYASQNLANRRSFEDPEWFCILWVRVTFFAHHTLKKMVISRMAHDAWWSVITGLSPRFCWWCFCLNRGQLITVIRIDNSAKTFIHAAAMHASSHHPHQLIKWFWGNKWMFLWKMLYRPFGASPLVVICFHINNLWSVFSEICRNHILKAFKPSSIWNSQSTTLWHSH